MAGHIRKAQLLEESLPAADVEIPGKGTVRARALSRAEIMDDLQTVDRTIPGAWECRFISLSLVQPRLTDDEVRQWRNTSQPNEMEVLLEKISEMSALTPDAAKDAWKEFESDADAEFPAPAGKGPGDDGGSAAG